MVTTTSTWTSALPLFSYRSCIRALKSDMSTSVAASLQIPPGPIDDGQPHVIQPLPVLTRYWTAIKLWLLKGVVRFALGLMRLTSPGSFREIAPTYEKAYPIHPSLKCRVFIPRSYQAGTKLPLYIDIHGGGFAICDPQTDDHYCRRFADMYGYCVVSINYRKAPRYRWPTPPNDCADLARAVLQDKDLPVDHSKVVMGGFSAGGNLSLVIAQMPGVKENVKGVIPIYPACDFTLRYRGQFRQTPQGRSDVLKDLTRLFNWGYVPRGTDRKQKLLSPIFATRDDLPQKIYFVGAEYDVLCQEANVMAKSLAGDDFHSDLGPDFEKNGIRWEKVPGVQHGFTHAPFRGKSGAAKKLQCEELYDRIDAWIKSEVF